MVGKNMTLTGPMKEVITWMRNGDLIEENPNTCPQFKVVLSRKCSPISSPITLRRDTFHKLLNSGLIQKGDIAESSPERIYYCLTPQGAMIDLLTISIIKSNGK
jgi:hypothetical protein